MEELKNVKRDLSSLSAVLAEDSDLSEGSNKKKKIARAEELLMEKQNVLHSLETEKAKQNAKAFIPKGWQKAPEKTKSDKLSSHW